MMTLVKLLFVLSAFTALAEEVVSASAATAVTSPAASTSSNPSECVDHVSIAQERHELAMWKGRMLAKLHVYCQSVHNLVDEKEQIQKVIDAQGAKDMKMQARAVSFPRSPSTWDSMPFLCAEVRPGVPEGQGRVEQIQSASTPSDQKAWSAIKDIYLPSNFKGQRRPKWSAEEEENWNTMLKLSLEKDLGVAEKDSTEVEFKLARYRGWVYQKICESKGMIVPEELSTAIHGTGPTRKGKVDVKSWASKKHLFPKPVGFDSSIVEDEKPASCVDDPRIEEERRRIKQWKVNISTEMPKACKEAMSYFDQKDDIQAIMNWQVDQDMKNKVRRPVNFPRMPMTYASIPAFCAPVGPQEIPEWKYRIDTIQSPSTRSEREAWPKVKDEGLPWRFAFEGVQRKREEGRPEWSVKAVQKWNKMLMDLLDKHEQEFLDEKTDVEFALARHRGRMAQTICRAKGLSSSQELLDSNAVKNAKGYPAQKHLFPEASTFTSVFKEEKPAFCGEALKKL